MRLGDLIGRVGNSGSSDLPHLHFQVQDSPSPGDSTGLPFVFDTQLLEGVPIDWTGAGVRRNLMPARNGVFGSIWPSSSHQEFRTIAPSSRPDLRDFVERGVVAGHWDR